MESKLNHTELDRYSAEFTDLVSQRFFNDHEIAEGEKLLEISSIKQVNLFVVMGLYQAWKQEFSKLKSPFFNYGSKDVRKALKEFMNVLSRNIAVEELTLKPLLRTASRQALLLGLSPYHFFAELINSREHTRVSLNDLKEWRKYIKMNRHLMDGLIARFEKDGIKEAFNDEAFRIFNEVLETGDQEPDDFEKMVAAFTEVLPLALEEIWSSPKKAEASAEEPKKEENNQKIILPLKDEEEQAPPNLNDRLRKEEQVTLADLHAAKPISSIKEHITLNQRYMFAQELFNNDSEAFAHAIERVEEQATLDNALQVLVDEFASQRGWDMESSPVIELLDVISKRYA